MSSNLSERPRAWEDDAYAWDLRRVPHSIEIEGRIVPHPSRTSGVFVVHGMGPQRWTETAASLRAGFEDALEAIQKWQQKRRGPRAGPSLHPFPPPFVLDGYWANYDDLEKTFPEDWAQFNDREREFFSRLWRSRVLSAGRTLLWILKQQVRLLRPAVLLEVGPLTWLLYLPLQIVMPAFLLLALIRFPRVITSVLSDVRIYIEPRGIVEKAIVQRIDRRVGETFMKMIGLGWDFRPLQPDQLLEASGERIQFERVIWVAHSLGTVVSYNVLSDLLHRAEGLGRQGDEAQKHGAARFRNVLSRFVTLGSPLDKIAFLFGKRALRPWPRGSRRSLIKGGEALEAGQRPEDREWWVNFYHVFDPVSGALSNPLICGDQPPANLHIGLAQLPGLAHIAYWSDLITLRFILGRTYGSAYLHDQGTHVWPTSVLIAIAALSYFVWTGLFVVLAYGIVECGPTVLRVLINDLLRRGGA